MKQKIIHITSVHPRYDTRIFIKECCSLATISGYEIFLLVADGKGDEVKNNVNIIDLGRYPNRKKRLIALPKKIYEKVKELNPRVVHFHDPELIFVCSRFLKLGINVIYDIHENVSKQILNKPYIPKIFRKPFSLFYSWIEIYFLNKFNKLILAEISYVDFYKKTNKNYSIVLNMPKINFLEDFISISRNKKELFYIGGISNDRGLKITLDAIKILREKYSDIFMHYIGKFDQFALKNIEIETIKDNVHFYGHLPLFEGLKFSFHAIAGLSVLKPIENYKHSYSTKIFEYMSIGLPVITSNFKLYEDIVEKYNCGICINPNNVDELVKSIAYLIENPDVVKTMGENGRKIVKEKFNWEIEEKKLFNIYKEVLKN